MRKRSVTFVMLCYTAFVLACCPSLFLVADETLPDKPFASATVADVAGWTNPERWNKESIEGTDAVRLRSELGYALLKIEGIIPVAETAMLKIYFHSGPRKTNFTAAIGAWGAPSVSVMPEKEGWQTAEVAFPMQRVKNACIDGKISVMFGGAGGVPAIGKVELYVPDSKKLMDTYRNFVRRSTEAAWADSLKTEFSHIDDYGTDPLFKFTEAEEKAGYCTFFRNYLFPVYPGSTPLEGERGSECSVELAQEEYEPCQFAIRASRDLPDCSAEIAGFLPMGVSAEISWVECVPIRTGAGSSSKQWHVQPNRLWPVDIFPVCPVKKDQSQAWWISFKASGEAKPGIYRVPFQIKSGGEMMDIFNVNVRVLPFNLPGSPDYASGFYTSLGIDDGRIIADMVRHGCNSLSSWPAFAPVNRNKEIDFTVWDAYFAELKRLGIGNTFIWFIGTKDSGDVVGKDIGDEKLKEILRKINDRVMKKEYPENFCITIDEAVQNLSVLMKLKEIFSWMEKETPALKRLGVSLDKNSLALAYQGMIDILSCNGSFQENSVWCAANKYPMYTYTVFSGRTTAAESRYNCGFNPWRYGASGTYGWALNWYNGNPFNDLDSSISDWGIILPNWTGAPISTPAWEAFREGVDDRRYIKAYMQYSSDSAEEKSKFLEELKVSLKEKETSAEQKVGDSIFRASVGDPQKLNEARKKIIGKLTGNPVAGETVK